MPIIARAVKKLHHDRIRTVQTSAVLNSLKRAVKSFRKSPSSKSIGHVFSSLDKAAKHNIIHPNKASRLKSRLSLLLGKKK